MKRLLRPFNWLLKIFDGILCKSNSHLPPFMDSRPTGLVKQKRLGGITVKIFEDRVEFNGKIILNRQDSFEIAKEIINTYGVIN